jgi:hypothetical protein
MSHNIIEVILGPNLELIADMKLQVSGVCRDYRVFKNEFVRPFVRPV